MTGVRLVCGVDHRRASRDAARAAARVARRMGAELILVHVVEPSPPVPVVGDPIAFLPVSKVTSLDETRAAQWMLREVRDELLPSSRARISVRAEFGDPAARLSAVAAETEAQLLFIGDARHGRFARVLHGGVLRHLREAAPCPVVVVAEGAPDAPGADQAAGEVPAAAAYARAAPSRLTPSQ
jgi:nucleotide-binding universal stress UspA family protein